MICIPGHGRGVDDIVGIDEQGRDRTDKAGYQHDFAIQVAEAGMAALAIEPMGLDAAATPSTRAGIAEACIPRGRRPPRRANDGGWRVWDVMRTSITCDAIRAGLDRVGCMGISGGGTITTFGAPERASVWRSSAAI
jgi:hypothetical protein